MEALDDRNGLRGPGLIWLAAAGLAVAAWALGRGWTETRVPCPLLAGPSFAAQVRAEHPAGSLVHVEGVDSGWVRVRTAAGEGWLAAACLPRQP